MPAYCKYHPLEPAEWHLERAGEYYCGKCVENNGGITSAVSILDGEELQYLGMASNAPPFWDILPDIFAYPLHSQSIMSMGALYVLCVLVMQVGGMLPLVVCIVALIVATQYGVLIVGKSAGGSAVPPEAGQLFTGGLDQLSKQLTLSVMFGVLIYASTLIDSNVIVVLAVMVGLFVLPVSVIVLFMEEDVASAINPSVLMDVIGRIGWAYLLLWVFLMVLTGTGLGVIGLFSEEVGEIAWLAIVLGVAIYSWQVGYRVLGYVVFQYQGALGFISKEQEAKSKRRKHVNLAEAKVGVLMKEGRFEGALKALSKEAKLRPNNIQLQENLSKLLLAMGHLEQFQAHGHSYMKTIYNLGDDSRLYYLYSDYHERDRQFMPEAPEVRYRLAEQCRQRGKPKEALRLLANLHKDAPNYAEVPHAYVLMSKILMGPQMNPGKAIQFLGFVKKNYAKYPLMDEVDQLLAECIAAKKGQSV